MKLYKYAFNTLKSNDLTTDMRFIFINGLNFISYPNMMLSELFNLPER